MSNENKPVTVAGSGHPGTGADEKEIVLWFLGELARAHELVASRARAVRNVVELAGYAHSFELRAALKRLADSICRMNAIVFADLDPPGPEDTK